MIDSEYGFIIDHEVESLILENKRDFRVCTTCGGPVIVPIEVKPPKPTDIKIKIGENILYVSKVQSHYVKRFDKSMLGWYYDSLDKDMC
ncbi:MAG: hypothetical protein HF967_03850 [Methanosarcinales archaeon]|jgi:hypothetical protein|nr:hypothetical protein [Methanosarcinales archaeon]